MLEGWLSVPAGKGSDARKRLAEPVRLEAYTDEAKLKTESIKDE